MGRDHVGEFELHVLWTVLRLGAHAYGVPIAEELERRAGRAVSVGALYATLERLERKGFLSSTRSDPTPERGGRARRYFRVTAEGVEAAKRGRAALERVWRGVRARPWLVPV
jgi:PadR family transcriptional regulator PadR